MAKFTELSVSRLKLPDTGQKDHFESLNMSPARTLVLRCSYGGAKAWRLLHYVGGKPKNVTLGRWPAMSVQEARAAARAYDPHRSAATAAAGTFGAVAEQWLAAHVRGRLRTATTIERHLTFYVLPHWRDVPLYSIKRRTVNEL